MKKALKYILGFFSTIIIFIIILPLVVSLLLQVGFVQKWAVDTATKLLSDKAQTTFSISKIELGLFKKLYLEDIYIQDYNGDTLAYIAKVNASIQNINFITGKIDLNTVTANGAKIYIEKDSLDVVNIKKVFDHFKPKIPKHDPPNFRLTAMQVNLLNSHFKMVDQNMVKQECGVNFKDIDIDKIDFQAQNVNVFNYDVRFGINFMKFKEKSGFVLNGLFSQKVIVNETGLRFDQLKLETPHSYLDTQHFNMLYSSWWAFTDFVDAVTIDAKILPSKLNFQTIAYFIQNRVPINSFPFEFEGSVVGTVARLVGTIEKLNVYGNQLSGNFAITGLPDVKNTTFEFDLKNLSTSKQSINDIVSRFATENKKPLLSNEINKILTNCQSINVRGKFYGLLRDFNTSCVVNTALGQLDAELRLSPNIDQGVKFYGKVATKNFEIGKMLRSKDLGQLSMGAQVNGIFKSGKLVFKTNANVEKVYFNDYHYHNIELDGEFNNRIYNGRLVSSADSNFLFDADGLFDFTKPELPEFNFEMNLKTINLAALKLNKRDSVSNLSAEFKASFTGTNIDNINGQLLIDSIFYINQLDTVHTGAIKFTSTNNEESKELSIKSDFADIKLKGKNSYSNIFGYFSQMASTYIPAFEDATEIVTGKRNTSAKVQEKTYQDGFYTLDVNVKKANNVASIFAPGLEIAEGTKLEFFFNPAKSRFSFSLNSEYLALSNKDKEVTFFVENLIADARNVADSLSIFVTANDVLAGNFDMPDFSIIGGIKDNAISLSARFNDKENGNKALINSRTSVYRTKDGLAKLAVRLYPSNVMLNNVNWLMSESNIVVDTSVVEIDKFELRNYPQVLAVSGRMGSSITDSLIVNIENFNVKPLSFIIEDLGYKIEGFSNGKIVGIAMFDKAQLFSSVDFTDIVFADYKLPDSRLTSYLDADNSRIIVELESQGLKPVDGYFDIKNQMFNIDLNFPKFDLVLLEPLLKDILVDTKGLADVKLKFSGKPETPTLNGNILIDKYTAKVGYTKVTYNLGGEVTVKNNRFELKPTKIFDQKGHSGNITAFFDSEYFTDLTFGVNASFTDLMALNTTQEDNSVFYGTGFGTGYFDIKGNERSTQLNVTAQTSLNSQIFMPFNNVSTINKASFITFVDPKKPIVNPIETIKHGLFAKRIRNKFTNELDIKLDIQVLPNTTAYVEYSNSIMNNIIKGQGRGRLRMHINPSQEIFSLEGPVEIEKGSYRLILEIADKTFLLQPGGRISWSGDPANPIVDFTGIYKVRASLEPLTGTIGGETSSANIDCGITLTGNLWNPTIKFKIAAPNATPETQNLLRNSLNTDEAMSMQFLSLFISNSFMPDMNSSSFANVGGSFVATTGFEFLSNQIGALFSSRNFNIRPTYRPRSETSAEEFGFKASLNLVQDKVLIEAEGNYATTQTNNRQSAPFTGGGNVTWLLNKSGTLSLKGFTRVIDRFDETQGLQESGVGVYFRQDFQNWNDLKSRYQKYLESLKQNKLERQKKREIKMERQDSTRNARQISKNSNLNL